MGSKKVQVMAKLVTIAQLKTEKLENEKSNPKKSKPKKKPKTKFVCVFYSSSSNVESSVFEKPTNSLINIWI